VLSYVLKGEGVEGEGRTRSGRSGDMMVMFSTFTSGYRKMHMFVAIE
jgi:hypothetical protein